MQRIWNHAKTIAAAVVLMCAAASLSHAQSLTVSLSGSAVNFNLTAGSSSNPGSTSITATTSCGGCFFRQVNVYAYFNNASAALTQSGYNIPSSAFRISNNGGAYQALTNTEPFGGGGAGIQLSNFYVWFGIFGNSHSDTMNFNIDLSGGTLPNLPPGTYTGTLTIRAQAP
jgi:hypothetical protein